MFFKKFSSASFLLFGSPFFVCLSDDGYYRILFIHSCILYTGYLFAFLIQISQAYNIESAKDESFIFRKLFFLIIFKHSDYFSTKKEEHKPTK